VIVDGGSEGLKHVEKPIILKDPSFDFEDWQMKGWTIEGNFPEIPTYSTRLNFGLKKEEGFIGTCEDGKGGYDDNYTGTITSPVFMATKQKLSLLVGGGSGEGVYVELLADGKRVYIARGKNTERMEEVVWDLSALMGKPLQLRIVDKETGGWGHVNVGRVRVTD
jgi:levanase